jgi:signal transduction histidine kinase
MGHLELMGFQPEPSDSVTRSTAAIRRGAERMRSTIEDLLLLAQVADPDAGIDAAPVDLASVVEDVLQLLSVTIDQKRLRVVMDATATPMTVWGEANELFQLCVNLVSNAVKYTPPGGTIAMSLARTPNDVQLVVADTGIGISAGDQDRLFEEFFRSTNPTALATPGTGLGLSIVYRVVNRHHGKIEVKSKLGTGTTFTVSLPAPP